jgi:hypothetical protein
MHTFLIGALLLNALASYHGLLDAKHYVPESESADPIFAIVARASALQARDNLTLIQHLGM